MAVYEPSILHDDVGNLNMTTWIPAPNSADPALRPVDDQIEGGAMSCCVPVDVNDPRVAHFWTRLNVDDDWELVQGFAESEDVYCTQNSSVVDDKVLLTSAVYFFSATVQKQLESWLMVLAVCKADTDADSLTGSSTAHAEFNSGGFPSPGVYVFESEDDGGTWVYKSTICTLPPTDNGMADEPITYPIAFNFGHFPTPSTIFIAGGTEATPAPGNWYVVVPCETYRQVQDYFDCDLNVTQRYRYTRSWSPAAFFSTDEGANWTQVQFKETFIIEPCLLEVELYWDHWDSYSLDTGAISRNLWGRDGGIPVGSLESRTAFESSDTDGWLIDEIIDTTVDMETYWGTGNDYPSSSPALADRAYIFIHNAVEDRVYDFHPISGEELTIGGVGWSDANIGTVGDTNLNGPIPTPDGQPLWVKLRTHTVVLDANGLFTVENAAVSSTDGWSLGFLPAG